MPPNLARRRDEQRDKEKSREKEGMCCVFDDWKLGYSIDHDPLIYIEGSGLIPVGNKSSKSPTSKIDPKSI